MHDLKKNVEIASNYIKKCGIEISSNITYKISHLTSAWGYCHKKTTHNSSQSKIVYTIEINSVLLDERIPVTSLQQTIIHELLHTCENSIKHTGIWKQNAKKINQEGIYEVTTYNSSASLKVPKEVMVEEAKNYPHNYQCTCCGYVWHYKRKPSWDSKLNLIENGQYLIRCPDCNAQLKKI